MEKGIFNTVIAAIATALTWLFGVWDTAIAVLVTFMSLDYCTGLIKGYIFKKLSSDIGLKGLARKAVIFIVLIVAVLLDRLTGNGQWIFRTLVCYFYIANEGISIIENCAQLGLPIPVKVKDALIQLKEGGKKNG
jgi:toxin secretion/phage lysis holin